MLDGTVGTSACTLSATAPFRRSGKFLHLCRYGLYWHLFNQKRASLQLRPLLVNRDASSSVTIECERLSRPYLHCAKIQLLIVMTQTRSGWKFPGLGTTHKFTPNLQARIRYSVFRRV